MAKKVGIKTKNKTAKQFNIVEKAEVSKTNVFDYLRFGESYTSLILGIVVVIISTVLLLSFVHNRNTSKIATEDSQISFQKNEQNSQETAQVSQTITVSPTVILSPTQASEQKKVTSPTATPKVANNDKKGGVYTIAAGDTLWNIAEKTYKSGYNWVDIARANNLSSPNTIHAGNKLTLPKVDQKIATVNTGVTNKNLAPPKSTVQSPTQAPVQASKITGESYKTIKGDTLWSIAVRAYGDGYQWVKIARANNLSNPNLIHSQNTLKIPRG